MAIDGGKNAEILAAEILALNNEELSNKLQQFKKEMEQKVMQADREINNK